MDRVLCQQCQVLPTSAALGVHGMTAASTVQLLAYILEDRSCCRLPLNGLEVEVFVPWLDYTAISQHAKDQR